jgi:site-specific DNA-methyltransferase (adenine-specific)
MGKEWDGQGVAFNVNTWRLVCRALKPGAHLLAFGGTRTYHRMASAIEAAGFEIRDSLIWIYGSGFPKSLNLGNGLGTALKPAHEPIVLARKPFKGSVRSNVETFGTGALNVDACRIGTEERTYDLKGGENLNRLARVGGSDSEHAKGCGAYGVGARQITIGEATVNGRWPANVCLDESAAMVLDEQSGELVSGSGTLHRHTDKFRNTYGAFVGGDETMALYGDSGGASRFFYVAKPSREERDMGCHDLPEKSPVELTGRKDGSAGLKHGRSGTDRAARNHHPTVKPVELMRWLVRLVTPPGGTCLDPFLGSGTTGMACVYEQREFIGIEREAEYVAIAGRRIADAAPLFTAPRANDDPRPAASEEQASLFES